MVVFLTGFSAWMIAPRRSLLKRSRGRVDGGWTNEPDALVPLQKGGIAPSQRWTSGSLSDAQSKGGSGITTHELGGDLSFDHLQRGLLPEWTPDSTGVAGNNARPKRTGNASRLYA
jgi:hypothetical protein